MERGKEGKKEVVGQGEMERGGRRDGEAGGKGVRERKGERKRWRSRMALDENQWNTKPSTKTRARNMLWNGMWEGEKSNR